MFSALYHTGIYIIPVAFGALHAVGVTTTTQSAAAAVLLWFAVYPVADELGTQAGNLASSSTNAAANDNKPANGIH